MKKRPAKPLKIGTWKWIPKGDHKMRKGRRQIIPESICDTKSCNFYGKPAAQGVCYSRIDTGAEKYFRKQMQDAEEHLKFYKEAQHVRGKKQSQADYIKTLESHFVCFWMNYSSCLDELIWLRGENAKMRLMLGKWNGRKSKPIK